MARTREELHLLLKQFSENCYYSPPASIQMKYPCIVYDLSNYETTFADNIPYLFGKRWTVTVIDPDPDGELKDKIAALPCCIFDRAFQSDNLNHFVFTLFF